jgi:hypothetical protein
MQLSQRHLHSLLRGFVTKIVYWIPPFETCFDWASYHNGMKASSGCGWTNDLQMRAKAGNARNSQPHRAAKNLHRKNGLGYETFKKT